MTHNNHDNLSMMDSVTTKYGKTTFVTLSKTLAIILVIIFFICLIATGLLVYSFSSTCKNETLVAEENDLNKANAQASVSSKAVCDNSVNIDKKTSTSTSTSTTPKTIPPVKDSNKDGFIRLPTHIVPFLYNIQLHPFIQENNFTFHGKESIFIKVSQSSKNITLHADELEIIGANVFDSKQQRLSVRARRMVPENHFFIIELDQFVEAGQEYRIDIGFKGVLNDMLAGFYRSSYVENNVTRWIAATQFQSTDARKAFPCWDEPAFKAKFAINIVRPKNMTAISNMPLRETIEQVDGFPDYALDRFQVSLPMSTYLVAFVVCDFKNISQGIFNIWARPSALSQAAYALEIGPKVLSFYEKFFSIPYPLPKVDMVAIPDFQAGAMENWGLIMYREPVLLFEEGVSSTFSRRGIAHVVAHELAHQWFGNLVTPEWWDDLWLNEGFATYAEYLGANYINPKWKEMDLFVVADMHETLRLDALKSSHQISIKVNDPEEIDDIFDRISYCKGASIIRMMKEFLGIKTFHIGLNNYLNRRNYSNANQDDLWQSMTEQAMLNQVLPNKTTVKEIMDTWTLQVGFPLITAMKQENGDLLIRQEKYSLDNQKSDRSKWWIPITLEDSQDKKEHFWMRNERELLMTEVLSPNASWYYINIQQNGYYRVNYDEENWISLISHLQGNGHRLFHSINRAQMIDDALQLAYAGYLSYDVALNVTLYLPNEKEYVPWQAALSNFKFLHNMFVRSASFDKFKMYLLPLLTNLYYELTFHEISNEEPTRPLIRKEIVEFACRLGFKDCIQKAVHQYQNWKNSANPDKENSINTDLRQVVYCTAIKDGGEDEWEFAWNRYLNANVASDKDTLLNALACSKEVWILTRYLERSISDSSTIRKHDVARVFASIADNPIGHDLVYRFLKTNWQRIQDYLGSSSPAISELVSVTTENFNSEEEVSDFKSFFSRKKEQFGIATRTAQQSIEKGEANIRWMRNYFSIVTKWFESARVI